MAEKPSEKKPVEAEIYELEPVSASDVQEQLRSLDKEVVMQNAEAYGTFFGFGETAPDISDEKALNLRKLFEEGQVESLLLGADGPGFDEQKKRTAKWYENYKNVADSMVRLADQNKEIMEKTFGTKEMEKFKELENLIRDFGALPFNPFENPTEWRKFVKEYGREKIYSKGGMFDFLIKMERGRAFLNRIFETSEDFDSVLKKLHEKGVSVITRDTQGPRDDGARVAMWVFGERKGDVPVEVDL